MTTTIVGLDLSLTGTGIAYGDGSTAILKPPKGHNSMARLAWILAAVVENVAGPMTGHDPDLVVIEGYSMGSGQSHAHELGELGGIVQMHLWESGIRFAVLPPSSLKKYATGKGNAKKVDMAVAAMKRASLEFGDDNQCDAWWLRQAGICWFIDDQPSVSEHPFTALTNYVRMPAPNRSALGSMCELTRKEAIDA